MYEPQEIKRHNTRLLLKAAAAIIGLIVLVYLYRGTFFGDPVFDRSLRRTDGDVVAALKDVGGARENKKGDIVSLSLIKFISRRRLPTLYHNNVILEYVNDVRTITSLTIGATANIDDRGMTHLREMTQLKSLNLNGLPITDNGLSQLHPLKNLRTLSLYVTDVTPEGVEKFKDAVPGCTVLHGSTMPK